jgi:hypothetical protein
MSRSGKSDLKCYEDGQPYRSHTGTFHISSRWKLSTNSLQLNPFMSFCLYIAARVFVQYLKSRPDDSTVYSSLQFVISALNAMKAKNPLTESFLVQLDVDLEGTGIRAIESLKTRSSHANQAMVSLC